MKRNLSDYIVALAVIACSLVLLTALTLALSGFQLKKPTRTLQIDYQDVSGVKVHSEVRFAGAPAGRVIAMRHLSTEERSGFDNKRNAVRVTISIDEGIPPVPVDTVASLGSDTLLGQKFIALSAGMPDAGTLANAAIIEGHPAYGIEQITQAAGPLLDNANSLLTKVKSDLGELLPKISKLTGSVDGLAKNGDALVGRATKLIADNEGDVKKDLQELQSVMNGLEHVLKNANGFIGDAGKFVGTTDKQLQEQMKELHVILLNLKVVSTHAKALTEALGEKPNRLIFSGKSNKLTPETTILKSQQPLPARVP